MRADEREYELECGKGHRITVDPTELQEAHVDDVTPCDCGAAFELADELALECHICSELYPVDSLDEARLAAETLCSHCHNEGSIQSYFAVPDSREARINEYEWARNGANPKQLERKGRHDYWEGVIHFCNEAEFASIFNSKTIEAANTGYYNRPAVCLTETPIPYSTEIQHVHGEYGYVFRKKDLIAVGGNPALYLLEELIKAQERAGGFAANVKPFVNLLRIPSAHSGKGRYDFLHEREWRVPHDIDLSKVRPFAVILAPKPRKFSGNDWRVLLDAARMYEEL